MTEAAGARALAVGKVPTWAGWLLVLGLWLLVRPYRGIRHDTILYTGQVLGHLYPDTIGRDLFLAYGSQDKFSIFSALMAPMFQTFGIGPALLATQLVATVLFLWASWLLARELPARILRWCALISLAVCSHTYGGLGAFSFAEPFVTARVLAEPFAIFGLVLLMRGRPLPALVAIVAAAAMHPLITLPALVVAWIWLALSDRRWWWAAVVTIPVVGAGVAGVAPFNALFQRFDPEWFAVVKVANENAFIATQSALDWAPGVFDLMVVVLGAIRLGDAALGRLARAIAIGTVGFVALWGLGADVLHDVLLTQIQLWRMLWLTHFAALILLPMLVAERWQQGGVSRLSAVALVLGLVAVTGNWSTGYLCVAWAMITLVAQARRVQLSPFVLRAAMAVSVLSIVLISSVIASTTLEAVASEPARFDGVGAFQVVFSLTIVGGGAGLLVLMALRRAAIWQWAGAVAAVAMLAWGASQWDQRSPWQRFVEAGFDVPHEELPFDGLLAPGAPVYWDGTLLDSWMLLHRPQYFGSEQGAGLLFNRATAVEFTRRRATLAPLSAQKSICKTVAAVMTGSSTSDPDICAPRREIVEDLCRIPQSARYFIFEQSTGEGVTATWRFRPKDPADARTFQLYDCAALLKAPHPSS